ncbi:hypothetical protein [Halohasta litorea]|uniref:Uncharacterized protein n=1 Tax=Halohasta litorea TaxID=869891 RepID=A0ABD6D8Z8_9EURY|nr:hypothetical protein [Halohasta litorea]
MASQQDEAGIPRGSRRHEHEPPSRRLDRSGSDRLAQRRGRPTPTEAR